MRPHDKGGGSSGSGRARRRRPRRAAGLGMARKRGRKSGARPFPPAVAPLPPAGAETRCLQDDQRRQCDGARYQPRRDPANALCFARGQVGRAAAARPPAQSTHSPQTPHPTSSDAARARRQAQRQQRRPSGKSAQGSRVCRLRKRKRPLQPAQPGQGAAAAQVPCPEHVAVPRPHARKVEAHVVATHLRHPVLDLQCLSERLLGPPRLPDRPVPCAARV